MIPAFLADIELKKINEPEEQHVDVSSGVTIYGYSIQDELDEDEEVLEAFGGGQQPTPPSPMAEAQAQSTIDDSRARREEAERIAAEERAAIVTQENRNKAASQQANVYNNAQGRYGDFSTGYNQGDLDRYGVNTGYSNALDTARLGWGDEDANVFLNPQAQFDTALSQGAKARRMDMGNQWGDVYGQNYANNAFNDTTDDNIIAAIMGQRGDDALSQINASRDRGQLNDGGYNRAMSEYDNQQMVARSDLDKIGQGILGGYRGQADTYNTNTQNTIDQLGFNDRFNVGQAQSGLDTLVNRLGSNLEGDFYSAVQGQDFFSPSSAISKGGALQGFYNSSAPPASATAAPSAQTAGYTDDRTASTNGVF